MDLHREITQADPAQLVEFRIVSAGVGRFFADVWWRTSVWAVDAYCNATCCILGEIDASQEIAWHRSIEVLDEAAQAARTLVLFPEDRCEGVAADESIVRLKLAQLRLERPRQWGACRLTLRFGMPMRPIEFADTVGLDICMAAKVIPQPRHRSPKLGEYPGRLRRGIGRDSP